MATLVAIECPDETTALQEALCEQRRPAVG
jgi:hypothetical protein